MRNIKEEFEKAFASEYPDFYLATKEISSPALWAAKWILDKCLLITYEENNPYIIDMVIREMAKDFSNDNS